MDAVTSTSPSGCRAIEVIEGLGWITSIGHPTEGVISGIDCPLVPHLSNVQYIAINDDGTLVAFVEGSWLHDLSVLTLQGDKWVRVFYRRLRQELAVTLAWQPASPPTLIVTTNKQVSYSVYEWSVGWLMKRNK